MVLGFLFFGMISGCKKTDVPADHTLSEITAISISCGNDDRCCSYSFWAHKEDQIWLFDAQCYLPDQDVATVFHNYELSQPKMQIALRILEENKSIAYVENYKQPKKFSLSAVDETTYAFCLTFSDQKQYLSYDRQEDLEEYFYRLAEEYSKEYVTTQELQY